MAIRAETEAEAILLAHDNMQLMSIVCFELLSVFF